MLFKWDQLFRQIGCMILISATDQTQKIPTYYILDLWVLLFRYISLLNIPFAKMCYSSVKATVHLIFKLLCHVDNKKWRVEYTHCCIHSVGMFVFLPIWGNPFHIVHSYNHRTTYIFYWSDPAYRFFAVTNIYSLCSDSCHWMLSYVVLWVSSGFETKRADRFFYFALGKRTTISKCLK